MNNQQTEPRQAGTGIEGLKEAKRDLIKSADILFNLLSKVKRIEIITEEE